MNDQGNLENLEARLGQWLKSTAPPAAPDLTERALARTAATPQRGTWTLRFAMPALAAAAVVALAVVVGLQLGRLLPGQDPPFGSDSSPTATATVSPTGSPAPTASPSSSVAATFRCENGVEGYAVAVPQDWFANPAVAAPEGGDDIPACRYFAPAEFEVRPNSGLPPTVAIGFQLVDTVPDAGGTVLSSTATTGPGLETFVREVEVTEGGFLPAGTLVYEYYISLEDGRYLWISTDSSRDGDYADHKAVMDQMVATLEILP